MADHNEANNDPLFWNRVFMAILIVALMFFGLPILVSTFAGAGAHHGGHGGEEHHDESNPLGLAYPIEFKVDGGTAVAEAPEIDLGTLLASADVSKGERSAGICRSCHTFEKGGANGTGPNLYGVVGRPVASVGGFGYSAALTEFGGEWTYERLDKYLENSKSYIPGTAMAQKIRKENKRADILAYMREMSDNKPAFPAPAPAPSAEEDVAGIDLEDHGGDHATAEEVAAH